MCAHPDDESFGLGAVIDAYVTRGARAHLLTLTHGEASTLGTVPPPQVGERRVAELKAATDVLGIPTLVLRDYPDGHLADVPLGDLSGAVVRLAGRTASDLLLTFDVGGITGHPDHQRATAAAEASGRILDLAVLAWTLPSAVADVLRTEYAAGLVGRPDSEIDVRIAVDRHHQGDAIACHRSQAVDNRVLWRRLECQGDIECLRWLRRPPRLSLLPRLPGAGGRPATVGAAATPLPPRVSLRLDAGLSCCSRVPCWRR